MKSIQRAWAFLVVVALLLGPSVAGATDWQEWKFLIRKRPVAVFFAIPPLIVTSPFMAMKWAMSDHGGDEDDEYEDEGEDEDEDE